MRVLCIMRIIYLSQSTDTSEKKKNKQKKLQDPYCICE